MPVRVQLSRRKGWKMPPNTVKVDRSTVFGNVSTCTRPHMCALRPCECCIGENPQGHCCVTAFREYVLSGIEKRSSHTGLFRYALDGMDGYPQRDKMIARLPELRGKNLACWCALDQPCHADVLLDIANAPIEDGARGEG